MQSASIVWPLGWEVRHRFRHPATVAYGRAHVSCDVGKEGGSATSGDHTACAFLSLVDSMI